MRAAAVALDLFERNPDHPGAAHYLIHAFDDPEHAVLALPALAAIRAYFAHAELTIAAPASIAAVFREETEAKPDHVLELPDGSSAVTAALRAVQDEAGSKLPVLGYTVPYALGNILLFGVLLGAGVPALYAVGVRAVQGEDARGEDGRIVWWRRAVAVACFGACIAVVVAGIAFIAAGGH